MKQKKKTINASDDVFMSLKKTDCVDVVQQSLTFVCFLHLLTSPHDVTQQDVVAESRLHSCSTEKCRMAIKSSEKGTVSQNMSFVVTEY